MIRSPRPDEIDVMFALKNIGDALAKVAGGQQKCAMALKDIYDAVARIEAKK